MKSQYKVSVYLDTRRKLKDSTYPLKLNVFDARIKKKKLYPTSFHFTEKDFAKIWETTKPQEQHKSIRRNIQELINRAEDIAKSLDCFSFEAFERKMASQPSTNKDVFEYYEQKIQLLKSTGKLSTAENYTSSIRSIKGFINYEIGHIPNKLQFREIDGEFLKRYEYYMIEIINRKKTTIGFYLRPLRAIFNKAKMDKAITEDLYPFKKEIYKIPSPNKFKKALNRVQLKKFLEASVSTSMQEMAKDFWFFLYNTAGMNIKDLALLKCENIQDDKIIYVREKTRDTSNTNSRPVIVYLNSYSRQFLNKYGNINSNPNSLVFDIIHDGMSKEEQRTKIKNFTKFLNNNIQKIALANGLPKNITTYWSRHSFATNAIRNGASLEQISQALNHQDITTTFNYFSGFEDEQMKKISENLMNF